MPSYSRTKTKIIMFLEIIWMDMDIYVSYSASIQTCTLSMGTDLKSALAAPDDVMVSTQFISYFNFF